MSEQHSPSKDDVIRWLRANGAKWDRPNYYDLAADMLLGLSEQQEATQGGAITVTDLRRVDPKPPF